MMQHFINVLMIKNGLNKTTFCNKVGISFNTLSKLLRNEIVHQKIYVKIANSFGLTLKEVLDHIDIPEYGEEQIYE